MYFGKLHKYGLNLVEPNSWIWICQMISNIVNNVRRRDISERFEMITVADMGASKVKI